MSSENSLFKARRSQQVVEAAAVEIGARPAAELVQRLSDGEVEGLEDPFWVAAETRAFRDGPYAEAMLMRGLLWAVGLVAYFLIGGWFSVLAPVPIRYERHRPEATLLYRLVERYYPDFLAALADGDRHLPAYVHAEFEAYLKCGRLEHGFLAVAGPATGPGTPRRLPRSGRDPSPPTQGPRRSRWRRRYRPSRP